MITVITLVIAAALGGVAGWRLRRPRRDTRAIDMAVAFMSAAMLIRSAYGFGILTNVVLQRVLVDVALAAVFMCLLEGIRAFTQASTSTATVWRWRIGVASAAGLNIALIIASGPATDAVVAAAEPVATSEPGVMTMRWLISGGYTAAVFAAMAVYAWTYSRQASTPYLRHAGWLIAVAGVFMTAAGLLRIAQGIVDPISITAGFAVLASALGYFAYLAYLALVIRVEVPRSSWWYSRTDRRQLKAFLPVWCRLIVVKPDLTLLGSPKNLRNLRGVRLRVTLYRTVYECHSWLVILSQRVDSSVYRRLAAEAELRGMSHAVVIATWIAIALQAPATPNARRGSAPPWLSEDVDDMADWLEAVATTDPGQVTELAQALGFTVDPITADEELVPVACRTGLTAEKGARLVRDLGLSADVGTSSVTELIDVVCKALRLDRIAVMEDETMSLTATHGLSTINEDNTAEIRVPVGCDPVLREHIILHELGHLLLDEDTAEDETRKIDEEALQRLCPGIDPRRIRRAAMSSAEYEVPQEARVELFASAIAASKMGLRHGSWKHDPGPRRAAKGILAPR